MKYFLFLFLVFSSSAIFAQQLEADTTDNKGRDSDSLKNIIWVVDSAYGAFRTEKFINIRPFFQSYKSYKGLIDTSQAGKQSEVTQFLMYNARWNNLRIQHTKMIKKLHNLNVKWENTVLDSFYLEKGNDHGYDFAYIYWVLKVKKKKSYILSAVAVKVTEKWYIMDELKYVGMVREIKKPKKKRRNIRIPDNIKVTR